MNEISIQQNKIVKATKSDVNDTNAPQTKESIYI